MQDVHEIEAAILLKAKMENAKLHKKLGYFGAKSNTRGHMTKKCKTEMRNVESVETVLSSFNQVFCKGDLKPSDSLNVVLLSDNKSNVTLFDGDIFKITRKQIHEMYNKLPSSSFGNVQEQKTQVNLSVRNAKECATFTIWRH